MKPGTRGEVGTQDIRGFMGGAGVSGTDGKGKGSGKGSGKVRGKGKERVGTSGGKKKGIVEEDEMERVAKPTTRNMGYFDLEVYSDFMEFLRGRQGGKKTERNSKGIVTNSTNLSYLFLSSSLIPVDESIFSASSPIQYSRVLTCWSSLSLSSVEALRNCWNRFFQRGHSSGRLKSKDSGGCSLTLAIQIPLLTPCNSSRVYFSGSS